MKIGIKSFRYLTNRNEYKYLHPMRKSPFGANICKLNDAYFKFMLTLHLDRSCFISRNQLIEICNVIRNQIIQSIESIKSDVFRIDKFKLPIISTVESCALGDKHIHILMTELTTKDHLNEYAFKRLKSFLDNIQNKKNDYINDLVEYHIESLSPLKKKKTNPSEYYDPIGCYIGKRKQKDHDYVVYISKPFEDRIKSNNVLLNRIQKNGLNKRDKWVLNSPLIRFISNNQLKNVLNQLPDGYLFNQLKQMRKNNYIYE